RRSADHRKELLVVSGHRLEGLRRVVVKIRSRTSNTPQRRYLERIQAIAWKVARVTGDQSAPRIRAADLRRRPIRIREYEFPHRILGGVEFRYQNFLKPRARWNGQRQKLIGLIQHRAAVTD